MTPSGAHEHAHSSVLRKNERLAFLLRFAKYDFAQTAVAVNRRVPVEQPCGKGSPFVRLSLLRELVSDINRESARTGERFNGLHTTVVRAREDPLDRVAREQIHETQRLPTATLVERPPPVVASPLRALARQGVSDQQHATSVWSSSRTALQSSI